MTEALVACSSIYVYVRELICSPAVEDVIQAHDQYITDFALNNIVRANIYRPNKYLTSDTCSLSVTKLTLKLEEFYLSLISEPRSRLRLKSPNLLYNDDLLTT